MPPPTTTISREQEPLADANAQLLETLDQLVEAAAPPRQLGLPEGRPASLAEVSPHPNPNPNPNP